METKSKIIIGSFIGAIVLIGLFLVLPALTVSSEEITIKEYDEITQTVLISDLSKDPIAEIQLLTPIHNIIFGLGWQRVAEFKINSSIDETVLKSLSQIEFYNEDINGDYIGIEGYYYKYKTIELQETLIYQEEDCDKSNFSLCLETEFINVDIWTNLTGFDTIPKGVTTIGLYYDVQQGQRVEWIPTYYNTKIEEWAVFEPCPREYYEDGADGQREYWGDYYRGNSFTIGTVGVDENAEITHVSLKMYRFGTPGTCYVQLQGIDGSDLPNGTVLSQGSFDCSSITDNTGGEMYNHTMSPNYEMEASTQYTLVWFSIDSDTNNKPFVKRDAGGGYAGGTGLLSNDNQSSWATNAEDYLFIVWGRDIDTPAPQLNITGILNYSNGTGVNLGDIYAVFQSNNTVAKNTTSNGTGVWVLENMPNGTYIITAYDPNNASIDGDVEAHVVLGT